MSREGSSGWNRPFRPTLSSPRPGAWGLGPGPGSDRQPARPVGRLLMPEPVKPGSSGGGVIDQDIEQAPANLA